jgi:hypothetical protein
MPDLRELLDAALGNVEPTFDVDDLRHRAAERRRQRFVTHAVIAVLVPMLALGAILALSSGGNERSIATSNGPSRAFAARTDTVLAFSDGLDGLVLVDLDHNRAVRKPLAGSDPSELFGPVFTGDAFVVRDENGVIKAVPIDGGKPRTLGAAVQAARAAQPGSVWLFNWPGGRIGAGAPSYQLVDVSGKVLRTPTNDSPDLAPGTAVPDIAYRDGLVFESITGVRLWDTVTNTVRILGRSGIPGDTNGSTVTWCDSLCNQLHITDGLRDRVVTAPATIPTFDVRSGRFSPDGRYLAVLAGAPGPLAAGSRGDIVLIDVKHGTQRVAVSDVPRFDSMAWSADGKQLFFAGDSYQRPTTEVSRVDLRTRAIQRTSLPFGGATRFVALARSDASAFLRSTTSTAAGCPATSKYPSGRTKPCAFRYSPTRRATIPGKPAPCPISKMIDLGTKTGNGFGRVSADGTLSILLPPSGTYRAPLDPRGGYDLKIPFFRDNPGHLTVVMKRLDGPGTATVDMHESSYAPTGFLPTGPLVSDLGCWRITGTQGLQRVTAVIRITENQNGPAG